MENSKIWMGVLVAVTITILAAFLYTYSTSQVKLNNLQEENKLMKTIYYYDSEFYTSVSESFNQASADYDDATFFHEQRDWKNAERSCVNARELYQKNSQQTRELKEGLASEGIDHPIITDYLDLLGEQVNIDLAMYEACEHYEAAYRFYDTYFNTGVSYDDPSYYSASDEIDLGNSKIMEHDAAVKRQNEALARIKTKWKKIYET